MFKAGDPADEMFVLIEGSADVVVDGTVVEASGPGAMIGEMALIEAAPRTATVIARTDCKFARISHKRFDFLVRQTPFFSLQVMKVMAERLRGMNRRLGTIR